MAVTVTYDFKITTRETLTSTVPDVASAVVVASGYNESATLNATSTPPATKKASFLMTLSGGAYTIDVSTLTDASGVAIGTGLRVQLLRIKNLGANTMTFAEGASNGLALSCGSIIVPTGGIAQYFLNDASPDIASGDRTIDVTGTAAQTAEVTIVFG